MEHEHEWIFMDDSFDHEFGTQVIQYMYCRECGSEMSCEEYKNSLEFFEGGDEDESNGV